MKRATVNPPGVPDTLRYGFSQAVVTSGGRRVQLSGQVGVDAAEQTVGDDLASQTSAALGNVEAILREVGGTLADVVALRIYVVEDARDEQPAIGEALRKRFPVDPPVTTWLVVVGLAREDWLIEIEAEAVLSEEVRP